MIKSINLGAPDNCLASRRLAFAALIALVVACGQSPADDQEAPSTSKSVKIEWYEGEVDDAFALAETTGKPLFLYWGAEWCPPCHYLKNRIFTRPEFVAKMRDFVPVYLDGDTARAQILGETLDVQGYPTVIIFDPMGQEVMRMPSTVPVDQYEAILDAAVDNMKPVKEILADVLATGPGAAAQSELNLLAFYSWGQDSQVSLSLEEQVDAFRRLYLETPETWQVERARFLALYLVALARQEDSSEGALSEDEIKSARELIIEVLGDRALRNANLLWIEYYADTIIDLLNPDETPERHELIGAWQAAAIEMEDDDSLSVADRLTASILRIDLTVLTAHVEAEDVEVPVEMQNHVRERATWALVTVTDESELQTVVNTLAYMLESAGLSDEAESMLLSKMNDTVAPYYFMSWVAGLREDAGDDEAALEWHRKAYDAAEGRYSRFRWGSTYLRRLIKLSPESAERIETDSIEVFDELLTHEDAFAGGNHARMDGLQSAYWTWNEDGTYDEQLNRIRDHVHAACGRYPDTGETSQKQRCESFLVPAEVEGEAAV